ncbi:hypothetical protein N7513_003132 [Penicillium frequentans]|nr:hypothetical protein N7513_003132 [Penicillium glabrum]
MSQSIVRSSSRGAVRSRSSGGLEPNTVVPRRVSPRLEALDYYKADSLSWVWPHSTNTRPKSSSTKSWTPTLIYEPARTMLLFSDRRVSDALAILSRPTSTK